MNEPLDDVTAIMRFFLPAESNSTPSIPPRVSNALKRWKRFLPDDVPPEILQTPERHDLSRLPFTLVNKLFLTAGRTSERAARGININNQSPKVAPTLNRKINEK